MLWDKKTKTIVAEGAPKTPRVAQGDQMILKRAENVKIAYTRAMANTNSILNIVGERHETGRIAASEVAAAIHAARLVRSTPHARRVALDPLVLGRR